MIDQLDAIDRHSDRAPYRQIADSLHQNNETVRRLDEAARGLRSGVERFKLRT